MTKRIKQKPGDRMYSSYSFKMRVSAFMQKPSKNKINISFHFFSDKIQYKITFNNVLQPEANSYSGSYFHTFIPMRFT
jgi:hypothetical protein